MELRKPTDTTSKYILKLIGVGLLITAVSFLAPQLPYVLLRVWIKRKFGKNYSKQEISRSFRYLKRKKFIAFEKHQGKVKLIVTKLGRKHMQKFTLSEITIKTAVWDNHWRLLTFDIPESHRGARHTFRRKLKELGFFHFQRSVFILPYKCEEEIKTATDILKITPYVHVLLTARFDSDKALVKKFNL